LNTGSGEISQADCDRLVENINKFDPCGSETLKKHLKSLLNKDGSSIPSEKIDEIDCISDELKSEIKRKGFVDSDEINTWCALKFDENYKWFNDLGNPALKALQTMNLKGAYILNEYFNFINKDGKSVSLSDASHFFLKPPTIGPSEYVGPSGPSRREDYTTGGAVNKTTGEELRLNLLKNTSGVPVLFTDLPHNDYLTKRWRGEPATYTPVSSSSSSSSTSSNPADCSPDFNSNLDKRHIKPWSPRERGSSVSTLNAMAHLRSVSSQPRITQVELSSLGPLLAKGFMGGSMNGGAPLEVTFSDCPNKNGKGDKLSVRQSEQYANLFKSVVQRLDKYNEVSPSVVSELKHDLEDYRQKECKLFQDAFRLANALKSQNNGSLPDKQPITDLNAFREASDEVAKSESHLLGCLTKILTETCKNP
jgi:hypothetical protein